MRIVIPVLFLLLPVSSAVAQIDMTGNWQITGFSTTFGITFVATGTITQTGNTVSGQLSVTGTPCAATVQFNGTLNGQQLTANVNVGGQIVVYSGALVSSGIAGSGNYTSPAGGCTNGDRGTWSARKVPVISAGGIVNAASYGSNPRAAGAIGSIFGSNFSLSTAAATSLPLPTALGGVNVQINGVLVPLFYVSPMQINFQFRWDTVITSPISVRVLGGGTPSDPQTLTLQAAAPGLFSINAQGTGQGTIQIANSVVFAALADSIPGAQARPANRGDFITIYCTGLGNVTNRPANGAAALANPLSTTTAIPTVTIGGVAAPVNFSGLSPGFVGLYQVNAQVPSTAPLGDTVAVVLTIGGATSNSVTIAVR